MRKHVSRARAAIPQHITSTVRTSRELQSLPAASTVRNSTKSPAGTPNTCQHLPAQASCLLSGCSRGGCGWGHMIGKVGQMEATACHFKICWHVNKIRWTPAYWLPLAVLVSLTHQRPPLSSGKPCPPPASRFSHPLFVCLLSHFPDHINSPGRWVSGA